MRVQCASNLRNIGQAIYAYAADNAGNLPQFFADPQHPFEYPGGYWMWDMEIPCRDAMVKYGVTQASQYCPTNADSINASAMIGTTLVYTWSFSLPVPTNPTIGYGIMGYVWLTTRPEGIILGTPIPKGYPASYAGNSNTFPPTDHYGPLAHFDYQSKLKPTTTYPTLASYHILRAPISSEIELVMDPILSANNPSPATIPYYFGPTGGFPIPIPSAHLYGATPDGGNIMYMDGHVDWRPFSQMRIRAWCGLGTGSPSFWW